MNMNEKKLTFKGSVTLSLIPVAIYVFFCIVLFIGFRAFNMEALAEAFLFEEALSTEHLLGFLEA